MEKERKDENMQGRKGERAKGRKDERSNPVPSLRGTKQSRTMKTGRIHNDKGCRSLCTSILDWLRRAPLCSGCHATLAMTKERLTTTSSIVLDWLRRAPLRSGCFGTSLAMTAGGNGRNNHCPLSIVNCQLSIANYPLSIVNNRVEEQNPLKKTGGKLLDSCEKP
jgi:hypothetical protein